MKSAPSGILADEQEMTGEHCLKVTPGDSLSDVRETAGPSFLI